MAQFTLKPALLLSKMRPKVPPPPGSPPTGLGMPHLTQSHSLLSLQLPVVGPDAVLTQAVRFDVGSGYFGKSDCGGGGPTSESGGGHSPQLCIVRTLPLAKEAGLDEKLEAAAPPMVWLIARRIGKPALGDLSAGGAGPRDPRGPSFAALHESGPLSDSSDQWALHMCFRTDFSPLTLPLPIPWPIYAELARLVSSQVASSCPQADEALFLIDGLIPWVTMTANLGNLGSCKRFYLPVDAYQPYLFPRSPSFADFTLRKLHVSLAGNRDVGQYLHAFGESLLLLVTSLKHLNWTQPQSDRVQSKIETPHQPTTVMPRPFYTWFQFQDWGKSLSIWFFDPILQTLHTSSAIPTKFSDFDSYQRLQDHLFDNQELYVLSHFVLFALRVRKACQAPRILPSEDDCRELLLWFKDVDYASLVVLPEETDGCWLVSSHHQEHPILAVLQKLFKCRDLGFKTTYMAKLTSLLAHQPQEPLVQDFNSSGSTVAQITKLMQHTYRDHRRPKVFVNLHTLDGRLLSTFKYDGHVKVHQVYWVDNYLHLLMSADCAKQNQMKDKNLRNEGYGHPTHLVIVKEGEMLKRIRLFEEKVRIEPKEPAMLWDSETEEEMQPECLESGSDVLQDGSFHGWCYDRASKVLQLVQIAFLEHWLLPVYSNSYNQQPNNDNYPINRHRFDLQPSGLSEIFYSVKQVAYGESTLVFLFQNRKPSTPYPDTKVLSLHFSKFGGIRTPAEVDLGHEWCELIRYWSHEYLKRCDLTKAGVFAVDKVINLRKSDLFLFTCLQATMQEGTLGMKVVMVRFEEGRIQPRHARGSYTKLDFLLRDALAQVRDYSMTDLNITASPVRMVLLTLETPIPRCCVFGISKYRLHLVKVDGRYWHAHPRTLHTTLQPSFRDQRSGSTYYLSNLQTDRSQRSLISVHYQLK